MGSESLVIFFFSSRRRHTRSVSAFLLNRSSDLREGSRNRRRLKANQTGKKFRVGIKSNISTNRNNLISGVDRCIHLNAMKKTTITSINRQTIKMFSRNAEIGRASCRERVEIVMK